MLIQLFCTKCGASHMLNDTMHSYICSNCGAEQIITMNATQGSQGKKVYTKWWFWTLICFGLLLPLFPYLDGVGTDLDNPPYQEKTETKTKPFTGYVINDPVVINDVTFGVVNVRDTNYLGDSYFGESTNYNFVVLTIYIENNSKKEITITSGLLSYYHENNRYNQYSTIYLENDLLFETIGIGISKAVIVVFEIPTKHSESDYLYLSFSGKKEKIFMKPWESKYHLETLE